MPERIVPESVGPGQALDLSKRRAAASIAGGEAAASDILVITRCRFPSCEFIPMDNIFLCRCEIGLPKLRDNKALTYTFCVGICDFTNRDELAVDEAVKRHRRVGFPHSHDVSANAVRVSGNELEE